MDLQPHTRDLFSAAVHEPTNVPHPSTNSALQHMYHWLQTPLGTAVFAALASIVLLLIINPPMIQKPCTNDIEQPRKSGWRIAIWSILVFVITFSIPWLGKSSLTK